MLQVGCVCHTLLLPLPPLLCLSSPSLCLSLSFSRSLSLSLRLSLSRSLSLWESLSRVFSLSFSFSLSLSFSFSLSLTLPLSRSLSRSRSRLLSSWSLAWWSSSLRWCLSECSLSLWCSFSPSLRRLSCSLGWSGSFWSRLPLRPVIFFLSWNYHYHHTTTNNKSWVLYIFLDLKGPETLTSLSGWRSRPSLFSLSCDLEVLALVFMSTFSPASTRFTASSLDNYRSQKKKNPSLATPKHLRHSNQYILVFLLLKKLDLKSDVIKIFNLPFDSNRIHRHTP